MRPKVDDEVMDEAIIAISHYDNYVCTRWLNIWRYWKSNRMNKTRVLTINMDVVNEWLYEEFSVL